MNDLWWPQRSEEGVRFPGTGVTGSCELPCGCWELNQGLLQKMLLSTEPPFQAPASWPFFTVFKRRVSEYVCECVCVCVGVDVCMHTGHVEVRG